MCPSTTTAAGTTFNQATSTLRWVASEGWRAGRGQSKADHWPVGHGQLEEVKYPANSSVGASGGPLSSDLALRWFDYWLKGVDNGIMDERPCATTSWET